MVVHPHDADTAWVFLMDGTDVWPRTSPDGRPAAYVTRNGGRSWRQRLTDGLPGAGLVDDQAPGDDGDARPLALYLGTTSGELWIGRDEASAGPNIARHPARDLRGGGGRLV